MTNLANIDGYSPVVVTVEEHVGEAWEIVDAHPARFLAGLCRADVAVDAERLIDCLRGLAWHVLPYHESEARDA